MTIALVSKTLGGGSAKAAEKATESTSSEVVLGTLANNSAHLAIGQFLNPISAAKEILAKRPDPMPTMPGYGTPAFAALTPLAQTVGANPQPHVAAVQALADHRAAISDALAVANVLAAALSAELLAIATRLLTSANVKLLTGVVAGPAAPLAVAAAVATDIGFALYEAKSAIDEFIKRLDDLTVYLQQATAEASATPLPWENAQTQAATQTLTELVHPTEKIAQPSPAIAAPPEAPPPPQPAMPMASPAHLAEEIAPVSPIPEPPQPAAAPSAAPSAAGSAAVAAATAQVGTPYVWGGSQPGGFDCSGLTSWAYAQAGVEIPRLAAHQAVGQQVSYDELLPGDLVVWEGHVAMYTGDGMMVEAGDPVQINPVRTQNIGMTFKGFWRPTA